MRKPKPKEPLDLDGRTLEGGGQLIRIAVCLSALLGIPVRVDHIRGNRSGGGGLNSQHLACVRWLAQACNAQLSDAAKGSKTLLFTPGEVEGGPSPVFVKKVVGDGEHVYECRLDIGTAGSTGLVLQAILPFILFTKPPSDLPVHLHISGGTNVPGSPSFEHIQHVLLPTLHRLGFPQIKATLGKRGWTQGGTSIGHFTLEIPPRPTTLLPAFTYRPSNLSIPPQRPSHLHAIILAPPSCHQTFTQTLLASLQLHLGETSPSNLQFQHEDSQSPKRMYLILIATIPHDSPSHGDSHILARDWLYDRQISSHARVAREMAEAVTQNLVREWRSGAWVDKHMRDQVVVFQALAKGRSEVFPGWEVEEGDWLREPSLHARTAEWVAKRLLDVKFDAEGRCDGVAFGDEAGSDGTAGELVGGLEELDLG